MEGETEVVQCAVPEDTAVLIEDPALELAIQGEHLCKEGRWEEGISCLEEALAASPTDPEALSALYSQLGHAYFYVKRYDRALDVYSQALANARRSGQRKEEAQAAANMTNTLRFMGNYRYAAEFGQLYLDMCREMKDVEGESHALYTLGLVYHAMGKRAMRQGGGEAKETLRKAVQYYKEHLELVTKVGDLHSQGRACSSLGSVYCLQGDFQAAVQWYTERLKADTQLGDVHASRKTYVNLASTHLYLRQYSKAEECYQQAMLMAQQLNNKPLEAQACFSLANTYSLAGDHIMAAKYLNKHLYFAEELGDVIGAAKVCWCLGNVYTEMGQHDKAYHFAHRHLELSMQLGDCAGVSTAKKNLADLMIVMKSRNKKCPEEKSSFFNSLFGRRKGHTASLEPPKPFTRQYHHSRSFDEGVNERHGLRKMRQSSSETTLVCDSSKMSQVHPELSVRVVDCTARSEEEAVKGEEQFGPGRDVHPACPLPSAKKVQMACQVQLQSESPPLFRRVSYSSLSSCGGESILFEGKEGMDDRLLDLIVECQGRRMDDQRSTAVPPVDVEAPKVLTTEGPSVVAAEEGDRPQMDRPRQLVQVDDGRRRLSNESLGSLDDLFFDTLMSAQNSRLEDQRSPDPYFERSQTLPGEDFLNLLLQLQSRRMEDQRSPFPNPFL